MRPGSGSPSAAIRAGRPYDASRPVMVFNAGGGAVQHDPRKDEREIWPRS